MHFKRNQFCLVTPFTEGQLPRQMMIAIKAFLKDHGNMTRVQLGLFYFVYLHLSQASNFTSSFQKEKYSFSIREKNIVHNRIEIIHMNSRLRKQKLKLITEK